MYTEIKTNRDMEATPFLVFIGLIVEVLVIVWCVGIYTNIKKTRIASEDVRTILLEFYKKQKETKK